jgi:acetolactate synthase-1/3 small subunit
MYNGTEGGEKKKYILGIVVEDETWVLERLSGLFVRRGFNIETIIVGKTSKTGLSHIIISLFADERTIEQLEKQVYKIIEVIKVVDLTSNSVVREHCLIKVHSTEKTRQDVQNFASLHKANVLEINHESMIIELVGSPEKIDHFLELMKPFGIKDMSRSGVNAMLRSN